MYPRGVECSVLPSSSSGGTIAAIVVSVLMLVVVIGAVVIILAVCVRRRKEKARSYSLNNSFRSTETVRSRVYINVIATSITQVPVLTITETVYNFILAAIVCREW